MCRVEWHERHAYEQLHELEQFTGDTSNVVQALELQSAVHREELRLKTGALNFVETPKVEQDAHARRLFADNDNLSRIFISMTEATQQGSSVPDDHDARLRRDLAEARTKDANLFQ